jgi:hypothetical protein
MPRAAPGDIVRGALRRNFPENLRVSVCNSDGYTIICPYRLRMESLFHPHGSRSTKWSYFTQQLSCFEVEGGCLGEVVSLVGDCRPPPPGNPRRPSTPAHIDKNWDEWRMRPAHVAWGVFFLPLNIRIMGGFF